MRTIKGFSPAVGLPRVAADYILVHVAMAVSMGIAIVYHAITAEAEVAGRVTQILTSYYARQFLLLSLIFPAVFFSSGFYSAARTYSGRTKAVVVARGVSTAILIFLAANFLLFREELIPRSVILSFCVLAVSLLVGARSLKATVFDRFDIRAKAAPAAARADALLVVGGAGYIGSILVRKLLERGYRVRILDNLVYGDGAIRDILSNPMLEVIDGDCRNIQSVVSAVKGVGAVVHLAAIVGDPACEQDRRTALEVNYAATRMLIEVAKGNGVERLVFASSCSVYGATEIPVDENSAVNPISLYAQTKIDSEQALLASRSATFHPVILRLATVFGHSYRPRFDLVVNLLTAKAMQDGVITIYNGEQWRPFIHVSDVAEGLIAALTAPIERVSGQIYNLGDSRQNYTLAQVAAEIQTVFPNTRVERVDNADRRNYHANFDKAREQLGFTCKVGLAEGIRSIKQVLESGSMGAYTDSLYNNQKHLQSAPSAKSRQPIDSRVMAAFAGIDPGAAAGG